MTIYSALVIASPGSPFLFKQYIFEVDTILATLLVLQTEILIIII